MGDAAGRPGDFAGSDKCVLPSVPTKPRPFRDSSDPAVCGSMRHLCNHHMCCLCRKFAENVGIAFKTPEEVFGYATASCSWRDQAVPITKIHSLGKIQALQ